MARLEYKLHVQIYLVKLSLHSITDSSYMAQYALFELIITILVEYDNIYKFTAFQSTIFIVSNNAFVRKKYYILMQFDLIRLYCNKSGFLFWYHGPSHAHSPQLWMRYSTEMFRALLSEVAIS